MLLTLIDYISSSQARWTVSGLSTEGRLVTAASLSAI